jgi:hypothetical protein
VGLWLWSTSWSSAFSEEAVGTEALLLGRDLATTGRSRRRRKKGRRRPPSTKTKTRHGTTAIRAWPNRRSLEIHLHHRDHEHPRTRPGSLSGHRPPDGQLPRRRRRSEVGLHDRRPPHHATRSSAHSRIREWDDPACFQASRVLLATGSKTRSCAPPSPACRGRRSTCSSS